MSYDSPEFLKMREDNKSKHEIASFFGISPATVASWVTKAIKRGLSKPQFVPWSPEKRQHLLSLWTDGELRTAQQIADIMGETVQTIEGQLNRMPDARKLRNRSRAPTLWKLDRIEELKALHARGLNDAQIGKAMGVDYSVVQRKRSSLGLAPVIVAAVWSKADEAELTRLWNMGLGGTQIALRMGRTKGQIEGKASRMGLPRDRGYPVIRKKAQGRDYSHLKEANRKREYKPKPKAGPKEDHTVIPLTARPWLTRQRGECSFPYGERGNIHSCCQPVWRSYGYCEAHTALCRDFSPQKKLKAA